MKRASEISAGLLMFVTGTLVVYFCHFALTDPFVRVYTSWTTSLSAVTGGVAALAAVGLFRWRRASAWIGIVAEVVLAFISCFPPTHYVQYAFAAVPLATAGLVYWTFVHTHVIHPPA